MATDAVWAPDWAVPPGEVLQEALDERGLSQAELARRMDRPVKTVNEIVKGKAALTPATAIQLERALGISASLWTGLESGYRQWLARRDDLADLASHSAFLRRFPVRDLVRAGHLPARRGDAETLDAVLRFFGVSSVDAWLRQWQSGPALRESPSFRSAPEALASWVRIGQLMAESADVGRYDPAAFTAVLRRARAWTRQTPFRLVLEKLVTECARAGVAVAVVPELTGTHISGAAHRTHQGVPVVQLSLRHKADDHFWFTFYHEAGHVLLAHGRTFLDAEPLGADDERAPGWDPDEEAADEFARESLVPAAALRRLLAARPAPDAADVRAFAREESVSPGVVVGRLQHDGAVPKSSLNHLKASVRFDDRT